MQASLHPPRGMEWRHQQPSPSPMPMPMPLPLGNAQSPFQVNAGAQEVCVIQRTVRQETMAATNLINFGGLEGGIMFKQQQQQQGHQSNQLLALVQQQQQKHQPTPLVPQGLYPSPGPVPPRSSSLPSPYFSDATVKGPRNSSFGRVSTVDIHGLPVYGELLLTDKAPRFDARLEIVCSCHGFHLPVSKFVQHINASHGMNPGSVVFMESGQSVLQWRKSLFARLGVKIDDDAGWDWNDANRSDAARSSRHFDLDYSAYVNSQLTHPAVAPPAALNYKNHHFQALHRRSTSQAAHFTREHIASAVSKPTTGFVSSEYFDFINPGGNRAYASAPAEQQQIGVGEKFRRADHGAGELRPDVSSIELRLGQPSQQSHQTGKPFDAFRSQYQFQECAALEPAFHHDYSLNVHQASQQQRLEKVNVLNFNQFGSTGLERTFFCERTKLWTDSAGQAIQNEASRVTLETFTPSQAEYPLEHMIKRVATARQLHNINSGSNQIDLGVTAAQQQQLPLESSQATSWTLSSLQCSEKVAAFNCGADGLPCYGRRNAGEGYRQQQHVMGLTASLLDDRDSVRIVEVVRNNGAADYSATDKGKNRQLVSETSALEKRACDDHQAALVECNRPADFSNVVRDDGGGMSLENGRNDYSVGQVQDHNDDAALPASSGALVSVGENEFPVTGGHFGAAISGPVSQPLEWKAPVKSAPLQVAEQEDKEADENSAATADGNGNVNERSSKGGALLSDVSTKSSENVLSGFSSDARHLNEETSTLESGSQKRDVVDEGSGIEKCSSEERCFANETVSAEPQHSVEKRECSADASSGMQLPESGGAAEKGVAEEEDTVDRRKRRRSAKWKSVNSACMSDSETSTRQLRNARATTRRSKNAQRFEAVEETDTAARHTASAPPRKGPSTKTPSKMMSIKVIMENSAASGQKSSEAQGTAAATATLSKQTRKRKLSELSTQACSALNNGPLSAVIPRGERSPRRGAGACRKAGAVKEQEAAVGMAKVPKRKRDPQAVEDVEPAAAKRKSSRHQQPPSAAHSRIDELTAGIEKVKWKSLQNDSFDDMPPSTRAKNDKKATGCIDREDSCSVCCSSSVEAHNQLVKCSSCWIKVHQACYGVPKVPKPSWSCRPCRSNAANIACVLCGYGGGAFTRAQQARAAIQELLKVWNARAGASRGLRRSIRNLKAADEEKLVNNSITASLGDPNAAQWVHLVCALWMPGTRCLNMETMSAFDVSGVSAARRRLTCAICKRGGGSCIQCNEAKCAVPFHPWCAHTKGLLQIESVNDTGGHVRFHGKCSAHHAAPPPDASRRSKCPRTQRPAR